MRRRKFLKHCTSILGSLYVTILAVPALGFLFSTLKRGRQTENTYRLARLNDLEPGVPQRFTINDQRVDAWTKYPSGPIGSVWISKSQDLSDRRFDGQWPAATGMDELKTTIETIRGEQWVMVEYQKFETGISEKVPIG